MGFLQHMMASSPWACWWAGALLVPALLSLFPVSAPQKSGRS